MISIDKYAYASKLSKIDPMSKLVFAIFTLGVCLWANEIAVSLSVLFIMGYVTVKKGGTPLSFFLKLLLVPISFLLLGVLAIIINFSHDPQVFLAAFPIAGTWIGISQAGLQEATRLFFKVLGSVSCLYFLSLSTSMVDLLVAMRRLKVPALMIELMSLIYRFIFILMETAENMFLAQYSRLGYVNLRTSYRSLGALVSTLFVRAYKKARDLFTSLEARGYEGELNVLEEPFEKNNKVYIWGGVLNILLIAITLALN